MNLAEAQKRYLNDPLFNALVDMMLSGLMRQDYSVYELRDACTLAINKFADQRPPAPVPIPVGVNFIDGEDHGNRP